VQEKLPIKLCFITVTFAAHALQISKAVVATPAQGSNMINDAGFCYHSVVVKVTVDLHAHRILTEVAVESAKTHGVPGEHVQSKLPPFFRPVSERIGSALKRPDATGFRSVASRLLRHDFTSTVGKSLRIDYRSF
jgi:hypothetical protein